MKSWQATYKAPTRFGPLPCNDFPKVQTVLQSAVYVEAYEGQKVNRHSHITTVLLHIKDKLQHELNRLKNYKMIGKQPRTMQCS